MIQFNYYDADIKKPKPLGSITIEQFIRAIRNPKDSIKSVFEKIKIAEITGDMAQKAFLKQSHYSFTPCIFIKGSRKYANIDYFTGLLVLDFDHLTENYASEFKYYLFQTYDFIIASWLSASKCGVRCLIKIPICSTVDEFKEYFNGLRHYHMGKYNGFDVAPQNCVLPLFLSYDPQILYRETAMEWSLKYTQTPNIPPRQHFKTDPCHDTKVLNIIQSLINRIADNGHPQLRKAAYSLGGYTGAGLIDYQSSIDFIEKAIDENNYLSQKSATYKKTAKTMIIKGMQNPLYL